jgi:hypothetical protein
MPSCDNLTNEKYNCSESKFDVLKVKLKTINPEVFYGFTISSRGTDINDNRFLRIDFHDINGNSLRLPSMQATENNMNPILQDSIAVKFATNFGIEKSMARHFTLAKIEEVKKAFWHLNIYKIESLDELIMFSTGGGCSIYYKKEGVVLQKERYNTYFLKAKHIGNNLYISLPSDGSIQE